MVEGPHSALSLSVALCETSTFARSSHTPQHATAHARGGPLISALPNHTNTRAGAYGSVRDVRHPNAALDPRPTLTPARP